MKTIITILLLIFNITAQIPDLMSSVNSELNKEKIEFLRYHPGENYCFNIIPLQLCPIFCSDSIKNMFDKGSYIYNKGCDISIFKRTAMGHDQYIVASIGSNCTSISPNKIYRFGFYSKNNISGLWMEDRSPYIIKMHLVDRQNIIYNCKE